MQVEAALLVCCLLLVFNTSNMPERVQDIIDNKNWQETSLGAKENWPNSLKTLIKAMLSSRFPMFLFWGPEFISFYNDAFRPSLGADGKHPHILGMPGHLAWEEIWPTIKPLLDQALNGEPVWRENLLVPFYRNGSMEDIYWTFSYSAVFNDDGATAGVLVICHETTEQVRSKFKVEESEKKVASLLMNSPAPMSILAGPEFIIENANNAMIAGLWGKRRENVIGKKLFDLFPELKSQGFEDLLHKVYSTGVTHSDKEAAANIFIDGERRRYVLDYEYTPLKDEAGKIWGILTTLFDVTEKIEARKKVEESRLALNIVIEASELGTWEMNISTGEIEYSNRFQEIIGYTGDNKLGVSALHALIHPDDVAVREAAYRRAYETGFLHYVVRVIGSDSKQRWIEKKGKLFNDMDGQPQKIIGTLADVTMERNMQEFLEQKVAERTKELEEKNKELEKINAELKSFNYISSHDLQEPLRKIHLFASRILDTENLSDKGRENFERMQKSSRRMQVLIEDLMAYSKVSDTSSAFEEIPLSVIIDEIRNDFYEVLEEKKGTIILEKDKILKVIPHQFIQLLHNLVSNSLKFAKDTTAPLITITVHEHMVPGSILLNEKKASEYFTRIRVTDNGIGFDNTYKSQIFDVFQRLHGRYEYPGTGIGLAIVKQIVENHEGIIDANGEPGQGATFDIYLPEN